jgi:hypothetical protein
VEIDARPSDAIAIALRARRADLRARSSVRARGDARHEGSASPVDLIGNRPATVAYATVNPRAKQRASATCGDFRDSGVVH